MLQNTKLEYGQLKALTTKCLHDNSLPQSVRDALFTWRGLFHDMRYEADYLRRSLESYVIAEAKAEANKKGIWGKIKEGVEAVMAVLSTPILELVFDKKIKRKKK